MKSETRLNSLLVAWMAEQEQGRDIPAAELCRDCPELADALHERIEALRKMNALLRGAADTHPSASRNVTTHNWQTGQGEPPRRRAAAPLTLPGYEVLGELGRGGMGVVYKARDTRLNRVVAVKRVLAEGASEEERARFRAEAEAVARLQHPHIVVVYTSGEHEGQPFFVMEYVEGGSLDRALAGRPQQPRDAARLVMLLARAVHAAHQRGIIHRDLKAANVLLAPPADEPALNCAWGWPKITDFGLARALDAGGGRTADGSVMGTPAYMSPEQAEGKTREVGPATDVYALGVILYETLTGRVPFKGDSLLDVLAQVRSRPPQPPGRLRSGVPAALEAICLKCLRKAPVDRYVNAAALAEDLGRFLADEPVLATAPRRRAWWIAGVAAAAVVVLATLLVVLPSQPWTRTGRPAEETRTVHLPENPDPSPPRSPPVSPPLPPKKPTPADRRPVPATPKALVAAAKPTLLLAGHEAPVNRVAFSPDGSVVVAVAGHGGRYGECRAWDTRTGKQRWAVTEGLWNVLAVSWRFDGKRVVTAGLGGAMVRDAGTGKELFRIEKGLKGAVAGVAYSPDGTRIATADWGGLGLIFDAQTGKELLKCEGARGEHKSLAFSPDGKTLAIGTQSGNVVAFNAHTGQRLFANHLPSGHAASLAFSPGGARLLAAGPAGIFSWDAATGKDEVSFEGGTNAMALSPNGNWLAVSTGNTEVKVRDAASGTRLFSLNQEGRLSVYGLAFSRDGRRLAVACSDRAVRVWDLPAPEDAR